MTNKNTTLLDLNDVLFEQLQRLNNPELKGDALETELNRANAVSNVAKTIISNADLVLKAQVAKDEKLGSYAKLPNLLGGGNE